MDIMDIVSDAQSTEESRLLDPDAVRDVGSLAKPLQTPEEFVTVSSLRSREATSRLEATLSLLDPKTTGRSPVVFGSTSPVITNFQPSMDGAQRNMINTEDTIRPIHAYAAVSMCALTILLTHFPVVAPFAPVVGLFTGLGSAYLFSKG